MPEDQDPRETQEWLEALDSVVEFDGAERAAFLLEQLHDEARRHAVPVPFSANTPYLNTIPVDKQPPYPGDLEIEHKHPLADPVERGGDGAAGEQGDLGARRAHRVVPVRRRPSTTSASTTSGTAPSAEHGGDLVFVQGHVAPGIYARSFLEGRLSEEQLLGFRQEVAGGRPVVLPAPVADAGLLAVPHGVDGPRPDHGDLPGPVPQVPEQPRPGRHRPAARLGVPGRRRDGRARVAGRDLAWPAGRSWTT